MPDDVRFVEIPTAKLLTIGEFWDMCQPSGEVPSGGSAILMALSDRHKSPDGRPAYVPLRNCPTPIRPSPLNSQDLRIMWVPKEKRPRPEGTEGADSV